MNPSLRSLSLLQKTFLSLIPAVLLIALCYFWADPIFAFWAEQKHWNQFSVFKYCTRLVDAIIAWCILYYCYFVWAFSRQQQHFLRNKKTSTIPISQWPGLNIANSVAISILLKDALKVPFGRYWPNTWTNNNPSLIHDHAYGFHWFHQGTIYQSFPSGHTTVGVAFMTALWLSYPHRLWRRWLGVPVAGAIVLGLLASNYHFIGDCIAEAWIGMTAACYVVAATKTLPE